MLFLLFQIGPDRYALAARETLEVIPLVTLKKIPQAPRGVAGLFNYRGQPVPAVDLCELTFGRPARERLSTRIIVVRFEDPTGRPQWLGLIAEHATGILRRPESDFVAAGLKVGSAPYLGPVVMDDQGVIQLLHAQHLLTGSVREMLLAETSVLTADQPACVAEALNPPLKEDPTARRRPAAEG